MVGAEAAACGATAAVWVGDGRAGDGSGLSDSGALGDGVACRTGGVDRADAAEFESVSGSAAELSAEIRPAGPATGLAGCAADRVDTGAGIGATPLGIASATTG